MKITPHFTDDEFEFTTHRNVVNRLPPDLEGNRLKTLQMMERIREYLSNVARRDIRINISSGYRCEKLNTLIGGSKTSNHVSAEACDWQAPDFGTPLQICLTLAPMVQVLNIGQLIQEYGRWVHTGSAPVKPINRILTYPGPQVGIHPC